MAFEPVIGEDARIELLQGSTYDETWSMDDAGTPHDFTDETLEWRFARDANSTPFLVVTSDSKVDPLTDGDGIYIDGESFRLYITAATLEALDETNAANFRPLGGGCDDGPSYAALSTLLLTDADDVTTVVAVGPVGFTPVVQPA